MAKISTAAVEDMDIRAGDGKQASKASFKELGIWEGEEFWNRRYPAGTNHT